MQSSTDRAVAAGLSVVLVAVFAIVGTGMIESSNTTTVLSVDSTAEWENGTLTNLTADNGLLNLSSGETSGTYDSVTFDTNHSPVTDYSISADIPDPDNSSVTLVVNSNNYDLEDGLNEVDVSDHDSFTLEYSRDSTSVESPEVDSVRALNVADSGLLGLIGGSAFGLLLILALLQHFGGRLGMGRSK